MHVKNAKFPSSIKEPVVARIGAGKTLSLPNDKITLPLLSLNFKDHLEEGDVIMIRPNGSVFVLFHSLSQHNTLFTTARCNSSCLMCSQPPRHYDDIDFWDNINRKILELVPKETKHLGVSGGEPTLLGPKLNDLLENIKLTQPNAEVDVLTNGRALAWRNNVKRLAALEHERIIYAIPVHSDYYQIHDYIAQSANAFFQTLEGIHNLARYKLRIEIRIVLHRQSSSRLKSLSLFIYKNMPFVEHVAFMALEYTGHTPRNRDLLWIDPYEYMGDLLEAVELLSINGIEVSLYNMQLCLLPKALWKFNRFSISEWKQLYVDECRDCLLRSECGGLFISSKRRRSAHIKPFK